MTNTTITWPGKSGRQYKYWIHPIGTDFLHRPGNYAFAKEARPGYWTAVYMGQTDDLGRRLSSHEIEAEARKCGATHVHAHVNDAGEAARLAEEKDLLAQWKCVCNTQLV